MMKRIILVLIPLVLVIGLWLWYYEGSMPSSQSDVSEKFVIHTGENVDTIASNLETQKLIRNKVVFYLVVKKLGIERKIQAGEYELKPSMKPEEIAKKLTQGGIDVWVTVVEGLRKEEVAALFQKSHGISSDEFLAQATEGTLFPDSYLIPKNASSQSIVDLLTRTHNQKAQKYIEEASEKTGLSEKEVVIVASLIEREARTTESRAMVARVLLNRIAIGMPLQVDATVQYALGYQPGEKSWWKRALTFDDLKITSPFNTYVIQGLPPAPIANAGLSAYKALADAPKHDYLFYLTGKDNKMHYATTLKGHEDNIKTYGVQ